VIKVSIFALSLLAGGTCLAAEPPAAAPLRVGIIGLEHGHVAGFLNGGALTPAGGASHRPDVQVVGIVEPNQQLFDKYAARFSWPASMHFKSIEELASGAHPDAALIFTPTAGHTKAVEECARFGIHAMMEKPLAVSYKDALAMEEAARRGKIHVLVDYETSWYGSNKSAHDLLAHGALGPMLKAVVRDGHSGPKAIHVSPEFFAWLTDPKLNGAGALYDFGCYGADLMTWLMKGEKPISVTAITRQIQPNVYPKVDDEADVLLTYPNAVAILQASWNWPFNVKDMDVYGRTGHLRTIGSDRINVRRAGEREGREMDAARPAPPYDDPLHYLAAVIRGKVTEEDGLSSLKTNITVSEILDAARRSAEKGQTVKLPPRP
jgi:predicted dehydrogenase